MNLNEQIAAALPASARAASYRAGSCGSPHSAASFLWALREPMHFLENVPEHVFH